MAYRAEGVAAADAAEGHEQAAERRRFGHQPRHRQQRHASLPLRGWLGDGQAAGGYCEEHKVADGSDDSKATDCNSDTFQVCETEARQIEKASPSYR